MWLTLMALNGAERVLEIDVEDVDLIATMKAMAIKRNVAGQITKAMSARKVNKSELARRMNTSRAALDRLLGTTKTTLTLMTLQAAATALRRRLTIQLT